MWSYIFQVKNISGMQIASHCVPDSQLFWEKGRGGENRICMELKYCNIQSCYWHQLVHWERWKYGNSRKG